MALPVSILFLTKSDRGALTFSLPHQPDGGKSQIQPLVGDQVELSRASLAAGGFELIEEGDDSAIAVRTDSGHLSSQAAANVGVGTSKVGLERKRRRSNPSQTAIYQVQRGRAHGRRCLRLFPNLRW